MFISFARRLGATEASFQVGAVRDAKFKTKLSARFWAFFEQIFWFFFMHFSYGLCSSYFGFWCPKGCFLAPLNIFLISRHFIWDAEISAYPGWELLIFRKSRKSRMSAQISKWATWARFCRNLPILEYDEAENGNFRKIVKNQDFQHFGPQISFRSHYRPWEFLRHFRDLEVIECPKCSKSVFFRFPGKTKVSSRSYFKMGKIRQKFADLA